MLITCTECGKKLKFADTMAGKKVRCPHCKATVRAPNEVDEVASAPKPNAIPSTAKKESAAWDKGEFSDDEPAPKKKSVAKKKRPADDNEDEDEDAPADAMRCAKCESARIEALPPNRFSRHPGFLCKKCGRTHETAQQHRFLRVRGPAGRIRHPGRAVRAGLCDPLHLGLGQLLGHLNGYNRKTKAGRRSAVNLCLYLGKHRITINEGRTRITDKATLVTQDPQPDETED